MNLENSVTQYPVGGPRQPVYDLMRRLGFSESNWSDKFWTSADGIEVGIYGAGSMAHIKAGGQHVGSVKLAKLADRLNELRRTS